MHICGLITFFESFDIFVYLALFSRVKSGKIFVTKRIKTFINFHQRKALCVERRTERKLFINETRLY